MKPSTIAIIAGLGVVVLTAAIYGATSKSGQYLKAESSTYEALELTQDSSPEELGAAYFSFGDFGALNSDALEVSASPWKLVTAAIALNRSRGDLEGVDEVDIRDVFQEFGFLSPKRIANWPAELPQPEMQYPLGQNVGTVNKIYPPIGATIANIGCAACHSSVTYDAHGNPDPSTAWIGGGNTSINLEAYTDEIYRAMLNGVEDPDKLISAVNTLYPDTGLRENMTLKYFIIPKLSKILAQRQSDLGRLIPFRASLAGATNGLGSLKRRMGLISDDHFESENIFNSVPDLGGRVWRSRLLNNGAYILEGEDPKLNTTADHIDEEFLRKHAAVIAYFTYPSMGITLETAEASIEPTVDIAHWLATYQSQPFPGKIDARKADQGAAIYEANCASCHGFYDLNSRPPQLISFQNDVYDLGTDSKRADLMGDDVVERVNSELFGKYIDAENTKLYSAPPLSGLWASAPYFHNGSVPTLWHLMHPESRPKRFYVGGHKLDMTKVGIAGQDDGADGWMPDPNYTPWAQSVLIETTEFGLSAQGHETEFMALSEDEKDQLLEFLKRL